MNADTLTKKEKILKTCRAIPVKGLINHIKKGEVTFDELKNAGLPEDKINRISSMFAQEDDDLWYNARNEGTVSSIGNYILSSVNGAHLAEAHLFLKEKEDSLWQEIEETSDILAIEDYMKYFPNGQHAYECRMKLEERPWLEAKNENTIEAYENYKRNYPGLHDADADRAIRELNEQEYLAREKSDSILQNLENDRNFYSPEELQAFVNSGDIYWTDLANYFPDDVVRAIEDYEAPSYLPQIDGPDHLQEGTTEVYFWGTPASGKTCALGAILSALNRYGLLAKKECQGGLYMDHLCGIFKEEGISTLPYGTSDFSMSEMVFDLRDNKGHKHNLTFIDLAGELFRALYRKQKKVQDTDERAMILNKVQSYLLNNNNKKIHFFIVAYGEANVVWGAPEFASTENILATSLRYLSDNKIIRKGTNGVYILVTKCDNMPCSAEERTKFAEDYVRDEMPSFYNNIKDICTDAGIANFKVLPFSIGDVYAKMLCRFDKDNTDEVINEMILKSKSEGSGFWNGLANFFKS